MPLHDLLYSISVLLELKETLAHLAQSELRDLHMYEYPGLRMLEAKSLGQYLEA